MKQFTFIVSLVFCSLVTLSAAPNALGQQSATSSNNSKDSLPAEVSALLPPNAISLKLGQLLMGPKGSPVLFHVWTAARTSKDNSGRHSQWDPSPFCVDLFTAGCQQGTWRYVKSAVYLGTNAPTEIDARWLQPSKEEGIVFIIISPAYIQTRFTLITFPSGIAEQYGNDGYFVQEFYQGGVGGGKILQDFGVDSRGYMTVISENWYIGKKLSSTVYNWDGRGFMAKSPRREHTK